MTKKQRIDQLRTHWYFICECSLCTSNERDLYESCIKCENPLCGELVKVPEKADSLFTCRPTTAIKCPECMCFIDEDTITRYQSVIAFTRQRLKSLREDLPSLEICLSIIENQGDLIPPENVWRVRSLDYAFNACIQTGVWIRAMEYGNINYNGMKYYYGEEHPYFGLFLFKLSKVCMYLKMYRDGLKYGQGAEKILKIALGPNHLLIQDELSRIMSTANEDVEILLENRMEAYNSEHELICKHCGKRKGLLNKNVGTNKKPINISNGSTESHEPVTNNGVDSNQNGIREINGVDSYQNGINETNGEDSKQNITTATPQKSGVVEKKCKFVASGETKARLSERVLEYLLSLKDF